MDNHPTCVHCGAELYAYMVTPRRSEWRALPEWIEATPSIPWGHWGPDNAEPLVCERVEVGETPLTLPHAIARV
jgi:hypothetical protein